MLFRQLNPAGTAVTILVFLLMLGGLCALALAVGQHARIIPGIVRGNKWFTPSVYVIIGAVLLVRTGAITRLLSAA